MSRSGLDAKLLAAHASGDRQALVGLYAEAAEAADFEAAAGFFLTQAYIFALDTGDPQSVALHARLKEMGREE